MTFNRGTGQMNELIERLRKDVALCKCCDGYGYLPDIQSKCGECTPLKEAATVIESLSAQVAESDRLAEYANKVCDRWLAAEAQVAELKKDAEWVVSSESQPAVGQWVLISYFTWKDSTKPRGYTVACRDEFNNWLLSVPNPEYTHAWPPTHWRPFAAIVAAKESGAQP